MSVNVTSVIVAAGSSRRMGQDKIFLRLRGKETILYSLEAMEKNPMVDEIILVMSHDNIRRAEELCKDKFKKLSKIVEGGSERTESVLNGIRQAKGKYIAIHDGARPLVSQKIITECIENAIKYDAATVYLPVTDTMKSFDGDFIKNTLDRSLMVSVQTPQCFNKEIYLSCIDKMKGRNFTDDCALFEECKIKVRLVRGEEENIKLTRKTDIIVAEAFLKERES